MGAGSAVAHDCNHAAAGRALSGAVHGGVPDAVGFVFVSRFYDKPRTDVSLRPLRRDWKRTFNR